MFSVTHFGYAASFLVLAHEVGHNQVRTDTVSSIRRVSNTKLVLTSRRDSGMIGETPMTTQEHRTVVRKPSPHRTTDIEIPLMAFAQSWHIPATKEQRATVVAPAILNFNISPGTTP